MKLADIAESSTGLVRDLYAEAMENNLPYPEFALACALHCIGGVAARAYVWPTATAPTFYSFIVGEPGAGKNGYLKLVESYLCAVEEKYVIGRLVSRVGAVAELSRWPCRTSIEDEIGNSWLETYAPRASEAKREIQDLLLTLYGENKSLAGTANKKTEDQIKRVYWPRFSIFGATTKTATQELTRTKAFERSGMLSRLLVWEARKTILPREAPKRWQMSEANLDALRRIARPGFDALNPETASSEMRKEPSAEVRLSTEAASLLLVWLRASSDKRAALPPEESEAFGQVYSRATDNAYRFAYAHCAGRESLEVSEADARFGVALASYHLEATLQRMGRLSEEQELMDLVLDFLRKNGAVSIRTICRNAHRRLRLAGSAHIRNLLEELASAGLVKRMKATEEKTAETWAPMGGAIRKLHAARLASEHKPL